MTKERKEYLFKNIRQYCKEEAKDVLCPPVYIPVTTEPDEVPQPGPSHKKKPTKRKRSV